MAVFFMLWAALEYINNTSLKMLRYNQAQVYSQLCFSRETTDKDECWKTAMDQMERIYEGK